MARENATEESNWNTDLDDTNGIGVRCPTCETQLAVGRSEPSCPRCDTSFFVRTFDEFALVERGGWTVAVSLGIPNYGEALVDG